MGKSTISMVIFNSFMLVITRGYLDNTFSYQKSGFPTAITMLQGHYDAQELFVQEGSSCLQ